jgi:hypothetical protein|tara:strand:- start:728 stop:850 length:123 start_codon:yes stop_codon:yes gene_type:complete
MKTARDKGWNYLTEGEERSHYKNKELLKELKEISKKNSKK